MAGVALDKRWTPEQDQTILSMRADRQRWRDIGEAVGRTVESCSSRYRTLVPEGKRLRYISNRRWTDEQEATIKRLLRERYSPRAIATYMGQPLQRIYSKIQAMREPGRSINVAMEPRIFVPPDREEDRRRRMEAPRDLTAEFFGDPPFSQSALAKKQGAFA